MGRSIRTAASRLLLFVLLVTFLSPSLGWQLLASHEQIEHERIEHAHAPAALHDNHDHETDAHGHIGHLLTHMPVHISTVTPPAPAPGATPGPSAPSLSTTFRDSEPPHHPPSVLSFA
jgi:hypothetical protein